MKLAIWGSTQTGKASLSFNFQNYYNLEKSRYKGDVKFIPPSKEDYVIKILYDDRITDVNYLLNNIEEDCKHIFLYRQNLLSQYLSWHHNEAIDLNFNPDILDIKKCRDFIEYTKENTSKIYNSIKNKLKYLKAISYEEMFHSNTSFKKMKDLGLEIKEEDMPHLINPVKWEVEDKFKKTQAKFTVNKGIEHFTYKENYDIIRDMFCEEFMYIDNDIKEVKFLRHET